MVYGIIIGMIVDNIKVYDGSYLRNRFAYDHFQEKTHPIGNIIAFRSPIFVDIKNLVDKKNITMEDILVSDDAINFCMEIPNISLFAGICFQRLFNSALGNIIAADFLKCDVEIDGAAIIAHKEVQEEGIIKTRGKVSVSDATCVNGAVLIHTGINIVAGKKAPATAFSTKLSDEECVILMHKGIEMFYGILQEIFVETTRKIL